MQSGEGQQFKGQGAGLGIDGRVTPRGDHDERGVERAVHQSAGGSCGVGFGSGAGALYAFETANPALMCSGAIDKPSSQMRAVGAGTAYDERIFKGTTHFRVSGLFEACGVKRQAGAIEVDSSSDLRGGMGEFRGSVKVDFEHIGRSGDSFECAPPSHR